MGSMTQGKGITGAGNPLRAAGLQEQRAMAAPAYAARGDAIASQKLLGVAAKVNPLKKTERGAAYPKTKGI